MDDQLKQRLKRLGVTKGAEHLRPAQGLKSPISPAPFSPAENEIIPLEQLLPGLTEIETDSGSCLIYDRPYPLTYHHGEKPLHTLTTHWPESDLSWLTSDNRFATLQIEDLLFIDTETTGLSGAGTIAFMVGVAFFTPTAFIVRQYFLRSYADELPMLDLLAELFATKKAVVSFNGRSFDLPLLDTRYLLNRSPFAPSALPHWDLLISARKLWRARLQSCSLSSLEKSLLSVHRTHEDVPGSLIPTLYLNYIRTGYAQPIRSIFYHNQIDMLSMVRLAQQILQLTNNPQITEPALDLFSLGKWLLQSGQLEKGEATLRQALETDISLENYQLLLHHLSFFLKRQERWPEAITLWQQLAAISIDDLTAHIELAKYYEWQEKKLPLALTWTEQALSLLPHTNNTHRILLQAELLHRANRLQRKIKTTTA